MKQKMSTELFNKMVKDVKQLIDSGPEDFKEAFYKTPCWKLSTFNFSIGMYIRNTYRLWEYKWTPELYGYGGDCSPNHPDNISQKIIETVWELHHAS